MQRIAISTVPNVFVCVCIFFSSFFLFPCGLQSDAVAGILIALQNRYIVSLRGFSVNQ